MEVFEFPLKHFRKIDSEPTYSMTIGDSNGYISWFESSLEFLKEKKEWFILVPNCPFSVWANVRVLNITKAIEELWETSVKIKNEGRRSPLGFNLQKYVDNAPSKWNDKY